jgi:hypothetical protein
MGFSRYVRFTLFDRNLRLLCLIGVSKFSMKGLMKSGKFSAKGFHQKLEKLSLNLEMDQVGLYFRGVYSV